MTCATLVEVDSYLFKRNIKSAKELAPKINRALSPVAEERIKIAEELRSAIREGSRKKIKEALTKAKSRMSEVFAKGLQEGFDVKNVLQSLPK